MPIVPWRHFRPRAGDFSHASCCLPETLKNLPDGFRAQRYVEFQEFSLNPFDVPEQVIVFHGQDQVVDICVDGFTTSLADRCAKPKTDSAGFAASGAAFPA
jgi:hypothetical protein